MFLGFLEIQLPLQMTRYPAASEYEIPFCFFSFIIAGEGE
jgi:hypothetical protein